MTIPPPVEAHIERLLRMLAGIEEAIIRLEASHGGEADRLIGHLRLVQDDIASALKRLEAPPGGREGRPEPPISDSHRRLGDSRGHSGAARDEKD